MILYRWRWRRLLRRQRCETPPVRRMQWVAVWADGSRTTYPSKAACVFDPGWTRNGGPVAEYAVLVDEHGNELTRLRRSWSGDIRTHKGED